MKAIQVFATGGPEVLEMRQVPVPTPQPGETLVRIACAGVNYSDVYQRSGLSPAATPYIPGVEASGVVDSDGGPLKRGTRVAWAGSPGAYAEVAAVPHWKLLPVPAGLDDAQAAAALMQGMTAQYLCETTWPVQAGHTALVHAGAGGVGLLLIQLLKAKGATVLCTVSSDDKAALAAQAGADHCIRYDQADFAAAARALAGRTGIDVVYDSVGHSTAAASLSVLRPLGMLVIYGQSSGKAAPIDPMDLCKQGSVFLARPMLAHHVSTPQALQERARRVLDWIEQGTLKLRIGARYPLAQAAQAHRALESRRTTGKLVLDIAI